MKKVVKQKSKSFKKPKILENYTCFKCFETKKETEFYVSNSHAYNKVPVCKQCLAEMYDLLLQETKDPHNAVLRMCNLFDIYYHAGLITSIEKEKGVTFLFKTYMSKVNSMNPYKGKTFEDSGLRTISNDVEEMVESLTEEEDVLFWGRGFSKTDYESLNFFLDRWCKTHKHSTEGELACLREICILQLQIEKNRQAKKVDTTLAKEMRDWMKAAAIDPAKAKVADGAASMDTYGLWIEDIEKTTPAEYFKDKKLYADFDSLKKYSYDFIYRPLKNLLTGSRDFDIKDDDSIFKKKVN